MVFCYDASSQLSNHERGPKWNKTEFIRINPLPYFYLPILYRKFTLAIKSFSRILIGLFFFFLEKLKKRKVNEMNDKPRAVAHLEVTIGITALSTVCLF